MQKLYKKLILYFLVFFIFSLWLEIQNRLFSQTDHHQRPKFLPFKASNLTKKSRQNITSMQWEFLCWQAAHKALYFSFIFGENSLAEINPHLYFFLIFVWLKCWDAGKCFSWNSVFSQGDTADLSMNFLHRSSQLPYL